MSNQDSVVALSDRFDQINLGENDQDQSSSSDEENPEPTFPSNLLQMEFKTFLPKVREYLIFLIYYLENDYVETECYEDDCDKSRIKILQECSKILGEFDTIYNGSTNNYDGYIWNTSTIRKERVYLISKCVERLLDTTVSSVVKRLMKSDRSTLRNAQQALMTLCVDMGMK